MANLGTLPVKQPSEAIPVNVSFADTVGPRLVTAISTVVTVPSGMTLTSQVFLGTTLQLMIASGTTAVNYKWTLVTSITLVGGAVIIVEDEFTVPVLDT